MKKLIAILAASLALVGSVTACSQPQEGDVTLIAPLTVNVFELPEASIELKIGQALNINTGSVDTTSFTAQVSNTEVVSFEQGTRNDSFSTNPGFIALKAGTSEVLLNSSTGEIHDPIFFTVTVSE